MKYHDALRLRERCRRDFCTFLQMGEESGSSAWLSLWGGKCVIVIVVACVANVHVQLFSHLNASRWISADLHTSSYSHHYLLIQLEVLFTAQHNLPYI